MRRGSKHLVYVGGCIAVATGIAGSAFSADDANPYHAIMERNVFDLKPPPPPPPATPEKPPTAAPNVKFTGTTSILGKPRALFMVQKAPVAGKPPAGPAQDESVILSVGERQDSIELVELDMKEGTCKIKNNGEVVMLTLPTGPPSSGGAPGQPGGGRGGMTPLGGPQPPPRMPTFIPQPQAAGGAGGYRGNPQANAAGASYGNGNMADNGLANNALGGITRDLRVAPQATDGPQSVEQAMLLLEANRMLAASNPGNSGGPSAPPLPPPAPGVAALLGQSNGNGSEAPPAPNFSLPPGGPYQQPFIRSTILPPPSLGGH